MKSKIKGVMSLAFVWMAINIANAQEAKVSHPTPQVVQEARQAYDRVRVGTASNNRHTLVEKFKDDRTGNKQNLRKASRYYNPLTFIYRLLGI